MKKDWDTMGESTKVIKVEIKIKDKKKVPVFRAVEVLQKIQDVVYNIGDHLRGNEPRSGGDYPSNVKQECSLVFKEIKSGSLIAELQIADEQVGLPDMKTCGERALERTNDVLETINREKKPKEKLNQLIDNPTRLYRILRDLEPIWPEERSDFTVSYGFNRKRNDFLPERKPVIRDLLNPEKKIKREVVQGRIIDFRVDKLRRILIDTPVGEKIVRYPPELEGYIWQHVGKIVEISGKAIFKGKKIIEYKLESESDLTKKKTLDVSHIKFKEKKVQFKEPIKVETEFEDEHYVLSNESLNLLVVSSKIKDGLKEINDQLITIWKEYALAEDAELTQDAIDFKNYLLSLKREGN